MVCGRGRRGCQCHVRMLKGTCLGHVTYSLGFSFSETAYCVSQAGLGDGLKVLTLLPPSPECGDHSHISPGSIYVALGMEPVSAGKTLCQLHPQPHCLLVLFPLRQGEKAYGLGS